MIIVACDNYGGCIEGETESAVTRQQAVGDRTEKERREFLGAIGWHEEDDFGDGKGPRHLCPFCHAKETDSIEPLNKLRDRWLAKTEETTS